MYLSHVYVLRVCVYVCVCVCDVLTDDLRRHHEAEVQEAEALVKVHLRELQALQVCICLCVCLSICLSVCLSTCLSLCLSVSPSV